MLNAMTKKLKVRKSPGVYVTVEPDPFRKSCRGHQIENRVINAIKVSKGRSAISQYSKREVMQVEGFAWPEDNVCRVQQR